MAKKDIVRYFYTDLALLRGRLVALELRQKKLLHGPSKISSIDYSGMPKGGHVTNTLNECTELININIEKEQLNEIFELYDRVQSLINTGRTDTKYSDILYQFYVEAKSISQIAKLIGCTPEYTSTLKSRAQYNLEVILGKDPNTNFNELLKNLK